MLLSVLPWDRHLPMSCQSIHYLSTAAFSYSPLMGGVWFSGLGGLGRARDVAHRGTEGTEGGGVRGGGVKWSKWRILVYT